MKHSILFLFLLAFVTGNAQIDAGLFRFPDVSATHIVFTYANDLWVVPKNGGTAIRLSSPAGVETWPKFSPDGNSIAFSGNYDGNTDAYVLPISGGVPVRLTQHGYPDRVIDWTNDGKSILFASSRESGKQRFNQFYVVPASGGLVQKLPFPYAEYGAYAPDGKQMAVVYRTQLLRNWKRYRGGMAADIALYDFASNKSENLTRADDANNELPMWQGNSIYFLSDRGREQRMNIWRLDLSNRSYTQITKYTDYDVTFPSAGPQDIVYEAGGKLYLLPFATLQPKAVNITVVTDRAMLRPKMVSAEKEIMGYNLSPDGQRVVLEARGEVFSVPAENGYVKNLTRSSGSAERSPAWSPNGKHLAYWSDQSGEYELYLAGPDGSTAPRKISNLGPGFRYRPFWSPDSKKLAFIDKGMVIQVVDVTTGQATKVDKALRWTHGDLESFRCSWSPDSRWLAYSRDLDNNNLAVFIFDTQAKKSRQVTSGFYSCKQPVFDPGGKYLFCITAQSFQPSYSNVDNTFIYANTDRIAAIALQEGTPSLTAPKNDTVALQLDEPAKKKEIAKKSEQKRKDTSMLVAPLPDASAVKIDLDGFERRMVLLPPPAGEYEGLAAGKGKIFYLKYTKPVDFNANGPRQGTIAYYDVEEREEKTVLEDALEFRLSANTEKILVIRPDNAMAVLKAADSQKWEKPLRLSELQMMVDPVQEWQQIFADAWRLQRDYFYDPGMHGLDWNLVRTRYSRMLAGAMTREEADYVIGEMIGELNASHTYHGGGDMEKPPRQNVGYLGIDWEADGDYYRIKKIIRGADWDREVPAPLDGTGKVIQEGMYILAVNGTPITTALEPYAAFAGLAGKAVELTYNTRPSMAGAQTVVVKAIDDEERLRNLAWIENMRKRVAAATNDEVGYIYVPSTGIDGQNELIRQFSAQWDKKALIIDERFNNGGQIPDRFIELLNRDPLAFWAIRDGETWPWPRSANFGPKVMLINGWSGSGGDAFPDYFRRKKLGPLIGTRTWGGLIGISGVPQLIDGGMVTVPTFRMYNPDGTWFREGHGVEPDIEVDEDLGALASGTDPQLERAITEIKTLLQTKEFKQPKPPAVEKRGWDVNL